MQHKWCGIWRYVQVVFIAYGQYLQMKIYVQVRPCIQVIEQNIHND